MFIFIDLKVNKFNYISITYLIKKIDLSNTFILAKF